MEVAHELLTAWGRGVKLALPNQSFAFRLVPL